MEKIVKRKHIITIIITSIACMICIIVGFMICLLQKENQIEKIEQIKEKDSKKEVNFKEEVNKEQNSQTDQEKRIEVERIKTMEASSIITVENLTQKQILQLFYEEEISEEIFQKIYGKSFKEDCTIPRENLRYIRVLHYGFDDYVHIGELIVNKSIAKDVIQIFYELYLEQYPIEKMLLIDNYDAQDDCSMEDNNTSCFNFRKIADSDKLSNHSRGLAIDINPVYNPYVREKNGVILCEPENGEEYADRSKNFPYKIDKEDVCYQIFTKYGFEWGGDWNSVKDYQHFQKE